MCDGRNGKLYQQDQLFGDEANHDEVMLKNGPYPQYLKNRILSNNGHLSNAACALAVAENMTEKLRAIWLCHLSEDNNHPELARKTVEEILDNYGITVGSTSNLKC